MLVRCEKLFPADPRATCGKVYDDATRNTICPHSPLWAPWWSLCTAHDLPWGINHDRQDDCSPDPREAVTV